MSPNKRIILNICASYSRSLIGVACGIFSTRWVLMALGHEDFGLYGIVGSIAIFMTFFNIQFSVALSRFYAVAIGKANVAMESEVALEECRNWFTTGVMIHTILPLVLVAIGYPIGAMAIRYQWLNIPVPRIETCVWLWRFVCISCLVSMVNVPFQAMYTAKQYIAELTIYSIVQVLVRTSFIYYMTTVSRDWLLDYGLMMCLVAVAPQAIICLRAVIVFPECRLRVTACAKLDNVKALASYAGWQTFGGLSYLARHQFQEVVVNKLFGPKVNAAYTIGSTVGGEAATLTGALNNAFMPAVATAYGEGKMPAMRTLAYRACKFGTLLTLLFAIPLSLEIKEVLLLWLKTPPCFAEGLCLSWLAVVVLEKLSLGHIQAVNASGQIAAFQFFRSLACFLAIPSSILLCFVFKSVYMVGVSLVCSTALSVLTDVLIARKVVGMSAKYWLWHIAVPLGGVTALSALAGRTSFLFMGTSFVRIILTTALSEATLLLLTWFILLDGCEREFVCMKLRKFI